ncbi:MAG TPA: hypothetical protein VHM69_02230 [Rubrobacter sp.]|nr:hypothetical protein [Rubrobacter sp.]
MIFEIVEVLGRSGDIDEQTRTAILDGVHELRRDMLGASDEKLEEWSTSVERCMKMSSVEFGSGLSQASAEDLRGCLDGIRH